MGMRSALAWLSAPPGTNKIAVRAGWLLALLLCTAPLHAERERPDDQLRLALRLVGLRSEGLWTCPEATLSRTSCRVLPATGVLKVSIW